MITTIQFKTLDDLYQFYNDAIFNGELSECIVNMSRHGGAFGFFAANRWRGDRGHSDREHRQDDGPYEHRQHAGLRPGHRPEDILGHEPADGKKKARGRQGSRRLNKNCRRNRKCNSGGNP